MPLMLPAQWFSGPERSTGLPLHAEKRPRIISAQDSGSASQRPAPLCSRVGLSIGSGRLAASPGGSLSALGFMRLQMTVLSSTGWAPRRQQNAVERAGRGRGARARAMSAAAWPASSTRSTKLRSRASGPPCNASSSTAGAGPPGPISPLRSSNRSRAGTTRPAGTPASATRAPLPSKLFTPPPTRRREPHNNDRVQQAGQAPPA